MADDDLAAAAATGLHILEGSIRPIKLSVASNEEILKAQPVDALGKPFPITQCSQLQDNPSLGLPLQVGSFESCGATQIDKCEGHFGFIELPAPIYHPSHVAELGKILNIICLCCLRLKKPNDIPPLCVTQVKKSNGARSLELKAPLKEVVGDGFWSFLDQFGFHTRGTCHRRPLHPKEFFCFSGSERNARKNLRVLQTIWRCLRPLYWLVTSVHTCMAPRTVSK
ncbi:DNA-directed RNA polymerase V subunit 1-like isoform X2 [Panicum hallii]|uniref:DNA-directed RNA polymerase V subunit 1-like isoform X2 n=1 Tax=Panicum hallii TaxID=206008 RepID=UPI000DF4D646|nr:DNA-directed RNA polymerase V subunit 1-like isoform X2 [Panicum hallii]